MFDFVVLKFFMRTFIHIVYLKPEQDFMNNNLQPRFLFNVGPYGRNKVKISFTFGRYMKKTI